MKQGTNYHMPVTFDIQSLDGISSIEFLFKQYDSACAESLKENAYKADGTGDVDLVNGVFLVPWSDEETYKFAPEQDFFLDTRIHLSDSTDNPPTEIVRLVMNRTLFAEDEA